MKKILSTFLLAGGTILALYACKKSFLDINPQGVLDAPTLSTEKGVNSLLIAAYAMLDGYDGGIGIGGQWGSGGSNFVFGSMGGGEANKGSDPGDQGPNMTPAIRHDASPTAGAYDDRWVGIYEGVKRTNTVIQILNATPGVSAESIANITGQARFLRAWYHFQARITFGKVPYIDEIIDSQLSSKAILSVANDVDIFPQIVADAKYAYENLPVSQDAVGRVNKYSAGALYGKILLFTKDFATAQTVLQDVVDNGVNPVGVQYGLNANFDDNFNLDFKNSKESVFAFQASTNDNAGARNGNWGDNLNTPGGLPNGAAGAGFFDPTFYFTNWFKTDAAGLPVTTPQNTEVLDPVGANPPNGTGFTQYNGNVDPRLDWTVGRNGVPYYDWGNALTSWQRDKSDGPFYPKKMVIRQSQVGQTHDASVWFTSGGVALNINFIRFSDVLLMLAEADAQNGDLDGAFALVNQVRSRAAATETVDIPAGLGTPKAAPYPTVFATKDEALAKIYLERTLELGMEGWAFFDQVRTGIAAPYLNAFYQYEGNMPYQVILKNPIPTYTSPDDDYYSIPQREIDLSHGLLKP